jgi:hypothetical protein
LDEIIANKLKLVLEAFPDPLKMTKDESKPFMMRFCPITYDLFKKPKGIQVQSSEENEEKSENEERRSDRIQSAKRVQEISMQEAQQSQSTPKKLKKHK